MEIRPLNHSAMLEISNWEYPGKLSVYSHEEIDEHYEHYFTVHQDKVLVGFGVTGDEARVQFQTINPKLLDVGLGMNPAFIGLGYGHDFARSVLLHARGLALEHKYSGLRCAILNWNEASQRVALKQGFLYLRELTNGQGTFKEFYLSL